jgi:hypothetical protein
MFILVILILSIIGLIFVMTLPSFDPDSTFTTIPKSESPDATTKAMELIIMPSGRAPPLQPTRICYPYGYENRRRSKVLHSAPQCDSKKKAQREEGEYLEQPVIRISRDSSAYCLPRA